MDDAQQIKRIIEQIKSKNCLLDEEFYQLTKINQSIPEFFARSMGVSLPTFQDMVKSGEISYQKFLTIAKIKDGQTSTTNV